MVFSIEPAEIGEKATIKNLLQSYLTELSRFDDHVPDYKDETGQYAYPYLDDYWVEDARYPYLLYCDDQFAGFALVRKLDNYYEMAEFYVLPEFRLRGVGPGCATELFKRHTGMWRIGFNKQNNPSRQLWKKLAKNLACSDIEEGEVDISHDYISFTV